MAGAVGQEAQVIDANDTGTYRKSVDVITEQLLA